MFPCQLRVAFVALAIVCVTTAAQAADLQNVTDSAMRGRRGTAVVLDVHSGRILAAYHLDVAARRVVHPGSAVKPFTLLALLEAGKVDDSTALMCKRSVRIAGHRLDCSHPVTAQPLDPAAALAYSCNSYFTAVALRLPASDLQHSLVREGFTSLTSLARNEVSGAVELATSPQQLQLQAIGEWGITVTPLELLSAYRQLALSRSTADKKLVPLYEGLEQSATYGMARLAQPSSSMKVAGKTGTAVAAEGAWTHAWFAGYAPAANPAIVLVVFLEKGHGGSEAAGVAREIFAAFARTSPTQSAMHAGGQR